MTTLSALYQSLPWDGLGVTPDDVAKARELYAKVPPDEQREAFHAFARKRIDLGAAPRPTRAVFDVGDGGDGAAFTMRGWDSGKRWNGWAEPLVEFDQAREFAVFFADCGDVFYSIDESIPAVIQTCYGERSVIEGDMVECDDGVTRHLFALGCGITWDLAEDQS